MHYERITMTNIHAPFEKEEGVFTSPFGFSTHLCSDTVVEDVSLDLPGDQHTRV